MLGCGQRDHWCTLIPGGLCCDITAAAFLFHFFRILEDNGGSTYQRDLSLTNTTQVKATASVS